MAAEILPGIDAYVRQGLPHLRDRRVALLTNPSGVTRDLERTADVLLRLLNGRLTALFSPEHGPEGIDPDGAPVPSQVDAGSGIPIFSLYGPARRPTPEMLANVDALVVDIQDVGVRFYTFTWTMTYVMEAAAEARIPIVILDRPNPLGGIVQGPSLAPGFESFVGRWPIPLRHGMTLGELARYFNEKRSLGVNLEVVPVVGWRRALSWEDTGLAWVSPSPALPTLDAVRVYPGTCLIEGTNLSEGRGTALPFQLIGAPWVDARAWAQRLNALELPGVRFRAAAFVPLASKWSGQTCRGVQIHITDPTLFDPLRVGLHLVASARALHPTDFAWLTASWEGEHGHFDLLIGNGWVRKALDAGEPVEAILAAWAEAEQAFAEERRPFLLYP